MGFTAFATRVSRDVLNENLGVGGTLDSYLWGTMKDLVCQNEVEA